VLISPISTAAFTFTINGADCLVEAAKFSSSDFSEKAVELYTDKKLWNECQKNGIEIINRIYDKEKLGELFINQIKEIQQKLVEHRTQNFLGSLLQHQTLQATKYMSKWIEVKNSSK